MGKIPYGKYSKEFREEAVKLITEENLGTTEAARQLGIPSSTLDRWYQQYKEGRLGDIGKSYRPLSETELEIARLKKENAILKTDCEILKKAAAYFAKESLPGTRR